MIQRPAHLHWILAAWAAVVASFTLSAIDNHTRYVWDNPDHAQCLYHLSSTDLPLIALAAVAALVGSLIALVGVIAARGSRLWFVLALAASPFLLLLAIALPFSVPSGCPGAFG